MLYSISEVGVAAMRVRNDGERARVLDESALPGASLIVSICCLLIAKSASESLHASGTPVGLDWYPMSPTDSSLRISLQVQVGTHSPRQSRVVALDRLGKSEPEPSVLMPVMGILTRNFKQGQPLALTSGRFGCAV